MSSVNVSNGSDHPKKLKVLVSSLLSHGHLNTCFAIGKRLLDDGHEVCFTVDNVWKDKVEKLGFKTWLLTDSVVAVLASKIFEHKFKKISHKQRKTWNKPVLERIPTEHQFFVKLISLFKRVDKITANVIQKYDPDVILSDNLIPIAAIYKSGKSKAYNLLPVKFR